MIDRIISPALAKSRKSILLLGPRQVGKSTLMEALKPDAAFNLALETDFIQFAADPEFLVKLVESSSPRTILLDEIQKLPRLLNTIQVIIDRNKSRRFFLTGSSARKLRRGRANLLPGRVLSYFLGPLTGSEIPQGWSNSDCLAYGSLPEIVLTQEAKARIKLLRSYAAVYIKEEIQAEAVTRNLEEFSRFLFQIGGFAGNFLDYSKLARRLRVPRHHIPRFLQILEDTLVGFSIEPPAQWRDEFDLVKHPKLYFFDNGVLNGLLGNFKASEDRVGLLFEHWLAGQIRHGAWAQDVECVISTFRTRGGLEADFFVEHSGKSFAIEAKATAAVAEGDVTAVKKIAASTSATPLLLHLGKQALKINGVWCHPWRSGLIEMGLA